MGNTSPTPYAQDLINRLSDIHGNVKPLSSAMHNITAATRSRVFLQNSASQVVAAPSQEVEPSSTSATSDASLSTRQTHVTARVRFWTVCALQDFAAMCRALCIKDSSRDTTKNRKIILSEVGFEPTPTEVDCDLNAAP